MRVRIVVEFFKEAIIQTFLFFAYVSLANGKEDNPKKTKGYQSNNNKGRNHCSLIFPKTL